MSSILDLAGMVGAIVLSMALAVGMEWVALRALMQLMPGKPALGPVATGAAVSIRQRKAA
jgi:hypothetical protein